MSERERTGVRDLTYSRWHRSDSTRRFLGKAAWKLGLIDIDCCEYCKDCGLPVALIEVKHHEAIQVAMTVTNALASMAGIRAYLVRYWPSPEGEDIARFSVRNSNNDVNEFSPAEYAEWLYALRRPPYHRCSKAVAA